jgi:putative transposase
MKTYQVKCKLTNKNDFEFLWKCSDELCDFYFSMLNTLRIDFEIKSNWPVETRTYLSKYEIQKQYSSKRLIQKPKYLMSWQIIGITDNLFDSIKSFYKVRKIDKNARFPSCPKDKNEFQPLYFSFQKSSCNIKILTDNVIELTFQNKKKINLICLYNEKDKLSKLKLAKEGHKLVFIDGEFYFHFCTDNEKEQLPETNESIFIDLGQKDLVTGYVPETNTIIKVSGKKLKSPKLTKKKEIFQSKYDQHKYKKSRKGIKLKKTLKRLQKKETNSKRTFLHKISRKLVNDYKSIIVGDLTNIKKNTKSDIKNINKYKDQFWPVALFVNMIKYKTAESSNRLFSKVNESNTTKTCCFCNNIQKITLGERVYKCTNCNNEIDRDTNSAINIYKKTLQLEPKLYKSELGFKFNSDLFGALRTKILEVK